MFTFYALLITVRVALEYTNGVTVVGTENRIDKTALFKVRQILYLLSMEAIRNGMNEFFLSLAVGKIVE